MTDHNNFANTYVNSKNNNIGKNADYITSQKNIIKTLKKKEYDLNTPFPLKPSAFNPIVGHNQTSKEGCIKIRKVGGVNENENTNNNIADSVNTEKNKNKEYDPYLDYLHKRGLLDGDTKTRYGLYFFNIDSSQRQINPFITTNTPTLLAPNPLTIGANSDNSTLYITVQNPKNFNVGDRIVLSGMQYPQIKIKNYVTDFNTGGNIYSIDIVNDLDTGESLFIRFDVDPLIDTNTLNNLPESVPIDSGNFSLDYVLLNNTSTSNSIYKEYDITYSDLFVDISGFITNTNSNFIGNIPLNFLNNRHTVYFAPRTFSRTTNFYDLGVRIVGIIEQSDANATPSTATSSIYIKLDSPFTGSYSSLQPSTNNGFTVDIIYRYYGGIPINEINSEYPITDNNIFGYFQINSIIGNRLTTDMSRNGYFLNPFGGNIMYIAKIITNTTGYYDQNSYIFDLGIILNNVVQARLVSSEIPNAEKVFLDDNYPNPNNKLYWQNLDDGITIYNIAIPAGNYNAVDLKSRLESLFFNTLKTISEENGPGSIYTLNNYMQVNIDINTDIVTFSSFKQAIINNPITNISPVIPDSISNPSYITGVGTYTLTITHPDHGLSVGDTVLISNAIDNLGIPSTIINATQTITAIVDANSYEIVVSNFNLNSYRVLTGGGNGVNLYIKNKFRMFFNYPDTMGYQLGFRNPGASDSITDYTYIVSNADPYLDEVDSDPSGNTIVLKNNSLNLSGNSYLIMSCTELNTIHNIGPVKEFFSKINLSGLPGKTLYNTFVPTYNYYYEPIADLSRLTINFYTPDGTPFYFNGLDHSYTIEFITLDEVPNETGISSLLGKVN